MVRILTDRQIEELLVLEELFDPIRDALQKQAAGTVERPDRPHYPIGTGIRNDTATGTGLVMPAYIHGSRYAGTKLVTVHEENPTQGLPTVRAQIVLTEVMTGTPVAFMAGTRITNARTACVGAIAADQFASDPVRLALFGAGTQARWQARAIDRIRNITDVWVYSPSDSRQACADDLRAEGIPATAVDSPADALADATVVVTATTSREPVFDADQLGPVEAIIAVGAFNEDMQELSPTVVDRISWRYADVPAEAALTGDFRDTAVSAADLTPLGLAVGQRSPSTDQSVLIKSVGSAVFDVAAASAVYQTAVTEDVGTVLSLE